MAFRLVENVLLDRLITGLKDGGNLRVRGRNMEGKNLKEKEREGGGEKQCRSEGGVAVSQRSSTAEQVTQLGRFGVLKLNCKRIRQKASTGTCAGKLRCITEW